MSGGCRHCFVVRRGELLPRWREAFPAASAATPRELPGLAGGGCPQLVWVHLPADDAVEPGLRRLRAALPAARLVALSDCPGDDEAIACFSAGAHGYCNSHAAAPLLRRVAQVVAGGGLWIGESLAARLLRATAHLPITATPDWGASLTEQERQVALAVAAGLGVRDIAGHHALDEASAQLMVDRVFERLGAADRLQLALRLRGASLPA